jgi:uncharacterized protein YegJ (DUF2314 family)
MSEPVYFSGEEDAEMTQASAAAQHSSRFFWRDLSWERRRIIPALDMAMIKLPFTDGTRSDGNPEVEYMWADGIEFDGITLSGTLLNDPNWLTSVKKSDAVSMPFSQLTDWMMTSDGKAYGAHTVNLLRSRMSARERKDHDDAWGLDFGEPNEIRTELIYRQPRKGGMVSRLFGGKATTGAATAGPGTFTDHPMCINILPKYEAQLKDAPDIATQIDERGWTLLHSEALAGNPGMVKLMVRYGADVEARTPDGRNAATLARGIGWEEIADYLSNDAKAEQA